MITSIPLFIEEMPSNSSVKKYTNWNREKCPHILIVGATGSGKTYALKLMLARICLYITDTKVYLCDFKAFDFKFLKGCDRYYAFENCLQGLENFYKAFEDRLSGIDMSTHPIMLVFDEWASFLNFLDKKLAEEAKRKLSTLLMLGRSYNTHVIISQQRADAQYFSTARDNFSYIISTGNLSKESKEMLFSDCKEQMKADRQRGTGYTYSDVDGLKSIIVPTVKNEQKLLYYIAKLVY